MEKLNIKISSLKYLKLFKARKVVYNNEFN